MSSPTHFQNEHEYDQINVGPHVNPIGNLENRESGSNDNRFNHFSSSQFSTNGFDQRESLVSPSTSVSSWYSNYQPNLHRDSLNLSNEQSQGGSWMSSTQMSKSFYSNVQQKPYITPTIAYNSSCHQRNYATGNTNSTQSLRPGGRMSNHLINAVELAFNHTNTNFDHTQPSAVYDGSFTRQPYLSMPPMRTKEKEFCYKGYQRHNPYVFPAFSHQRNHDYSNGSTNDQVSYSCPNCKRVYNWKYNLTRHMRYECGTESRFQCAHCKRCFPHKQNAIHHNIRKHRIHHEKNHLYVENGDVIIRSII